MMRTLVTEEEKKQYNDALVFHFFNHPRAAEAMEILNNNPSIAQRLASDLFPSTAQPTLSSEVIESVKIYSKPEHKACIKNWLKSHKVNEVDEHGRSLLHYAAAAGRIGLLQWFIDKQKANFQLEDAESATPLIWAAAEAKEACSDDYLKIHECIRLLADKGATFTSPNRKIRPESAVKQACLNGDLPTLQLLVELGADLNDKSTGLNALSWAEFRDKEKHEAVIDYIRGSAPSVNNVIL